VLAVTVSKTLTKRYGVKGYQSICAALDAYVAAAHAHLVVLDDPDDEVLKGLSLPPATGVEPGSLLLPLRAVRQALGVIDSILLVGGDGIIPYWKMSNPVSDRGVDPDAVVFSDNPYGTDADTLDQYLAPPLAVGRLTDFPRGSVDDFVTLIDAATASRNGRAARSHAVAVTNTDWANYSRDAASSLPSPVDWYFSPGYLLDRDHAAAADREFLYFNLHGFSGVAEWKGYDSVQERFVTAVTPDAFDQRYVSGAVAFAENCYGAETDGRTPSNSCALRLVQQGAAFVGATGLAYGSHLAPNFFLDDADALARSFWGEFTSGVELGESLRRARQQYLDDSHTPPRNPFKRKTLLQFILLGDPGWN
jgi:hypothetical protein